MADRTVSTDIIANDKTARGINSAANRFERFANSGRSVGTKFMKEFSSTIGEHKIASLITAAVVAGAPAAGAAAAAGILLGLGGSVLAGGILAAARSPAVAAAWKQFAERGKKAFAGFGTPFEAPLIRAADTFGASIERIGKAVKPLGAEFAPLIDKLAPALAEMAERAMPAILDAARASKPLFDTLAEHMPAIGDAIAKFFRQIEDAGPSANLFFERLLQLIEQLLPFIGGLIRVLADWFAAWELGIRTTIGFFAWFYRGVLNIFGGIVDGAARAFGWMPGIGPKLQKSAEEFRKFRDKANGFLQGIEDQVVGVTIKYGTAGNVPRGVPGFHGSASFAAGSFAFAGAGPRTGGPTPVRVTNEVTVSLDGQPFRDMTVRAVRAAERRAAWRERVGRR